jgi:tetratricopeptide (TPR) repeat protein
MGVGVIAHLLLRRSLGALGAEHEIQRAAMFYGACYLVLLAAGLFSRLQGAPARAHSQVVPDRAPDLEETGRFGMAARVYEREGQLDKAAHAAERAGEWERAARLYRRAGEDFNAGEMFSRAEQWNEALTSYEQAHALPAAARLCVRLGQVDRAVALFENAGNPGAAVQVLEEAGRVPTPEQYRKAGRLDRAVAVLEERGEWLRAAEVCEHELGDVARAVSSYRRAGASLQAGRLLEAAGKREEALTAFAASPAGLVDAARVALALGRGPQASELLARVPPSQLENVQDDATLALVARVMLADGRHEQAVRILQGIKRRGNAGGAVHLLLGRGLLKKGLTDLAIEELRTATGLPLDPDDETQAAYALGRALEDSSKPEEALSLYQRVLQKDLEYADVEARYRKLKDALAVHV